MPISGIELKRIIANYGIVLTSGPADAVYELASKEDCERFLRWYKSNAPIKPGDYTQDDFDCNDFAWLTRAYALLWMRGKCFFGYVEAASAVIAHNN